MSPLAPGVNVGDEDELDSFFQPFVNEKIPKVCFKCGRVGHQINACLFVSVPQQEINLENSASSSPPLRSEDNLESGVEKMYGPWIQVVHRKMNAWR